MATQTSNYNPVVSDKYEFISKIGRGTFGEVSKARDKTTRQIVAIKKIFMPDFLDRETQGFPITALREIMILQKLKHDNIVKLIEMARTSPSEVTRGTSDMFIVLEFCEHDLDGLLKNNSLKFSFREMKMVLKQLLQGMFFMHINKIIHRDLKPSNILVTKNGVLKLADFGLARPLSTNKNGEAKRYTNGVVTFWYRPPELFLGERNYGPSVDMWSAGCIMAEIFTRKPFIKGTSEQDQLKLISIFCGEINPNTWPGVERLELFPKIELPKGHKRKVKERITHFTKDPHALDLLDKLLALDPSKRIDANNALDHDFFWTDPPPFDLGNRLSNFHKEIAAQHQLDQRSSRLAPQATVPHSTSPQGIFHTRVY